jgi:hypothetical protein
MLNRDYTWRAQADASSKDPNSGKSQAPRGDAGKILSKRSVAKLTESVRSITASRTMDSKHPKKPR